MTRETSIEAIKHIRGSGLLSQMKAEVYAHLLRYGPMTGGELDDSMSRGSTKRGNYHKRLSELQAMNAVKESGSRKCRITGRRSIVWEATHGPIQSMSKRQSKADILHGLCLDMLEYLKRSRNEPDRQFAERMERRLYTEVM